MIEEREGSSIVSAFALGSSCFCSPRCRSFVLLTEMARTYDDDGGLDLSKEQVSVSLEFVSVWFNLFL